MFFEKIECLVSTYKNGSLSFKLPKIDNNARIREFISYLNQLLNFLKKKNQLLNNTYLKKLLNNNNNNNLLLT